MWQYLLSFLGGASSRLFLMWRGPLRGMLIGIRVGCPQCVYIHMRCASFIGTGGVIEFTVREVLTWGDDADEWVRGPASVLIVLVISAIDKKAGMIGR